MQHRCEIGPGERAKDFLRFAQRIAKEHGNILVLDRIAAKSDDLRDHFLGRRQAITGNAVSCFHDQSVGRGPFRGLGRLTLAQFEIAGVKQRIILGA